MFGLTPEAMAQGVVDVVNAKMADAIRTITVQRGIDPRDFSLVAFGGAGPAQAGALAEELQIREVIVPVHPGAFFRLGHVADGRAPRRQGDPLRLLGPHGGSRPLETAFAGLEEKGRRHLLAEGIAEDAIAFERAIDFRYYGQEYVLTIPVPERTHRHGGRAQVLRCGVPIGSTAIPARRTASRWRISAWPRSAGWHAPAPPRPRRNPRERLGRAMSSSPAGR